MWWFFVLAIPPMAWLVIAAWRKRVVSRSRIATWSNLHSRGKLFAEQLVRVQMGCWRTGAEPGSNNTVYAAKLAPGRDCRWPSDSESRGHQSIATGARASQQVA